ncbi:MAG: L,D-transpeptidase family protein [Armatimonadota bacterium]|nr:MAG: L,D-transpeptidase family protein [Armatimonadota bacterium]
MTTRTRKRRTWRVIGIIIIAVALVALWRNARLIYNRAHDAYFTRAAYPQTDLADLVADYQESHPGAIDKQIVIDKSDGVLQVFVNGELLKRYAVTQGPVPERDKEVEGDMATPEGEFYVSRKNPRSSFHKFLGVSYPTMEDAERGLRDRLITRAEYERVVRAAERRQEPPQNTRLGGNIGIHGGACRTIGCISLTDDEIDELYGFADLGTQIVIRK